MSATRPKPPRRSNIDDGTTRDDRGDAKGYFGNHFAKPTVTPTKLLYAKDPKKPGVNTLRLFPLPIPKAAGGSPGEFYDGRVRDDDEPGAWPQLTDWIIRVPVFAAGDPGITFILYDPDEHPGQSLNDLKWKCPSHILAYAADKASKKDEGRPYWSSLLKGSKEKGKSKPAVLQFGKWMYLAYGALYERGPDEVYLDQPLGLDPKQPPLLFDLGKDVGSKIYTLSRLLKAKYRDLAQHGGLPTDVNVNKLFEIFDPVGISKGVFFRAFSKESKDPRPAERKQADCPAWWDAPEVEREDSEGKKKESSFGYEVYATKEWQGKSAALTDHAEALWKRLKPISSQLIFLSPTEQVALLSQHIKDPHGKPALDLFEYAFSDREEGDEWLAAIPDSVRAAAKGKVQSGPGSKGGKVASDAAPAKGKRGASADDDDDEDDEDEDEEETPKLGRGSAPGKRGGKPDASVPAPIDDDEEDDDEDDEDEEDDDADSDAEDDADNDEDDDAEEDADDDSDDEDDADEEDDDDEEEDADDDSDDEEEDADDDSDEDDEEDEEDDALEEEMKYPGEDEDEDEEEERPAKAPKKAPAKAPPAKPAAKAPAKPAPKKGMEFEEPPAPAKPAKAKDKAKAPAPAAPPAKDKGPKISAAAKRKLDELKGKTKPGKK